MKTARIDVSKPDGAGLSLGDNVSITLTGTVKGLDTYDMADMPVSTEGETKAKKEPPKVTVNLEISNTTIKTESAGKKAFEKAYEGKKKAE